MSARLQDQLVDEACPGDNVGLNMICTGSACG